MGEIKLGKIKIIQSFTLVVVIWFIVFPVLFLIDAKSFPTNVSGEICDSVVVFTGGRDRIRRALWVVKKKIGAVKNVFISGVHEQTSLEDILKANEEKVGNVSGSKYGCRFILGKSAHNTMGNAEEVGTWTKENGISKILLITSDYHMRRSIVAVKCKNPNLDVVPCAVKTPQNTVAFLIKCFVEINKLFYTWIKKYLE